MKCTVFFLVSNSEILGHPDLYYRLGEMINLTCVISGTAGPPRDIFWYHNQSVIGFYSERKVIILEDKGETSTSQLLLKDADKNDQVIHNISKINLFLGRKFSTLFFKKSCSGAPL